MATSRTSWMRILSVVLVVILVLEAVEARPPKKEKRRQRERVKHCGAKGHPCEPGSRKLCCTVGYTCKVKEIASNLTKSLTRRKPNIGTCEPMLPIRKNDKEIDEHHPSPKTKSSPTIKSSPLAPSNLKVPSNKTIPSNPHAHSSRSLWLWALVQFCHVATTWWSPWLPITGIQDVSEHKKGTIGWELECARTKGSFYKLCNLSKK